jgi:thiamine pyrophosphokinase
MGSNSCKIKRIALVAGGYLSKKFLKDITSHDIVIGVDRGAWWLLSLRIIPDFAIGDFDSVSSEELAILKENSPNVVQYKPEKNETDLELGLALAMTLDPGSVTVFGSIGSRFDHSLAGILLLERFGQDITVVDENNEISVIYREKIIRRSTQFPYSSFIALTDAAEVTLEGFKYPLDHGILERKRTLGISNEILETEAKITVHSGTILCVQSRG